MIQLFLLLHKRTYADYKKFVVLPKNVELYEGISPTYERRECLLKVDFISLCPTKGRLHQRPVYDFTYNTAEKER